MLKDVEAAVLRDPEGAYTIETVTLDNPGPHQVVVAVRASGLCHTDALPRMTGFPVQPPLVTGHEGAGVVEWVGADVTDVAVGDHVVMSFAHCGSCPECQSGHPGYCAKFAELNLFGRSISGGVGATDSQGSPVGAKWFGQSSFATRAVVDARSVVVVDDDLDLTVLAPLGCGVITGAGSVLNTMRVSAGASIAIFGVGPVGMSALMAAKAAGATRIIAVDLHESRLDLAKELGATDTFVGSVDDLADQIQTLSGGGTNFAFDTTGVPSVILTALASLRSGGMCGTVAVQLGDLVLGSGAMDGKALVSIIEGDSVPRTFIPQLIDMWKAGEFPVDRLIRRFDFAELNEAEKLSGEGEVIKAVVVMP
ncbi:NAD(P)-dependent alcohol dehydrogenase [Rhodococcus sp. MSC1_016]|uniref:NAD(P)-dependent alcohol dehydrogenase n=1 Tax=Rhodococcus sp. MSC1_016 TaxID=2909266 RepID=UPI00202F93B0|nr:NAD(P)-dependent alcohol dehydrogenase [Rhodococcus sp. MSC1_016]